MAGWQKFSGWWEINTIDGYRGAVEAVSEQGRAWYAASVADPHKGSEWLVNADLEEMRFETPEDAMDEAEHEIECRRAAKREA